MADRIQFYNKSGRPNRYNLPDFIVRAFEFSPRDWDLKFIDNSIGVTTLMDSPKIKLLKRKYKDRIKEDNDISNDVKLMFGTMAHLVIERAIASYYADPEFKDKPELIPISEKRIVIPYPASELTGGREFNIVAKPDIMYLEPDGAVLYDFKTGTTWDWKFRRDKIRGWKEQLDMYKYGIEEYGFEDMPKHIEELVKNKKLKIKKAIILLWMKDWQGGAAERESNYPEFEMMQIEISLSSNQIIKSRITSRIVLHSAFVEDPQQYNCTPEERWSKKTAFAVYTKPDAAKATKVFDSKDTDEENKADAMKFLEDIVKKFPYASIQERAGLPTRCVKNYCNVGDFCNQFRHENGLMSIEEADKRESQVVISDDYETKENKTIIKTTVELVGDLFSQVQEPPKIEEPKKDGFTFTFGDEPIEVNITGVSPSKEASEERYDKEDDEYSESLEIINNLRKEDAPKTDLNLNDITFDFKL